jgi:hypothetical protein
MVEGQGDGGDEAKSKLVLSYGSISCVWVNESVHVCSHHRKRPSEQC